MLRAAQLAIEVAAMPVRLARTADHEDNLCSLASGGAFVGMGDPWLLASAHIQSKQNKIEGKA